ncbi:hypothetical protein DM02DRAFT_397730 [Periconia macrospinosa]|uniref:Uncharacterized protein n=1 Tax=Periconia macrospinosa TaxID=97972 RepID=A0A2V1DQV1_9PLEO|nr:hypothetical protein DM02DRAFT_397730 [Periconia macrospinosa]
MQSNESDTRAYYACARRHGTTQYIILTTCIPPSPVSDPLLVIGNLYLPVLDPRPCLIDSFPLLYIPSPFPRHRPFVDPSFLLSWHGSLFDIAIHPYCIVIGGNIHRGHCWFQRPSRITLDSFTTTALHLVTHAHPNNFNHPILHYYLRWAIYQDGVEHCDRLFRALRSVLHTSRADHLNHPPTPRRHTIVLFCPVLSCPVLSCPRLSAN